jgi:hypothetical protein
MSEKYNRIILWLIALLLLASIYWGYRQLEWIDEEIDLGFDKDAIVNPYLAAEQFLNEQNINIRMLKSVNEFDELPDNATTLIITASRKIMGENQQERLWKWIEDGGHLITSPQGLTDFDTGLSRDDLLNRLGLYVYPVGEGKSSQNSDEEIARAWMQFSRKFNTEMCLPQEDILSLEFDEGEEAVKIAMEPGLIMEDYSESAVSASFNPDGIQFIQYEVGEGLVTLMTDTSIWSNGKIGCYDHAYLLWTFSNWGGSAWILYDSDMPSLITLLWNKIPLEIILVVMLILLWLWKSFHRNGPIITINYKQRRQLLEHLKATGIFLWRRKYYKKLLGHVQQSIYSTMTKRHQGFNKLEDSEQYDVLEKITRCHKDEIIWAISLEDCKNRDQFLRAIQVLQSIRNKL